MKKTYLILQQNIEYALVLGVLHVLAFE